MNLRPFNSNSPIQPGQFTPTSRTSAPPPPPPPGYSAPGDTASFSRTGPVKEVKPQPPAPPKKGMSKLGKFITLVVAAASIGGIAGNLVTSQANALGNDAPKVQTQSVATPQKAAQDTISFQGAEYNIAQTNHSIGDGDYLIRHYTGSDAKDSDPTLHSNYAYDHLEEKGGWVLYGTREEDKIGPEFQKEAAVDWNTKGLLSPAGHAGRFVSVNVKEGGYSGGEGGDTYTTEQATVDTKARRQVTLNEVIGDKGLEQVYNQVEKQLASNPKGEAYQDDPELIHDLVNHNFSLNQSHGKTQLTVQLPTTDPTSKVAEFHFNLPKSISVD